MNYSKFDIDSFHILEGYVEKFTNSVNPMPNFTQEKDGFQLIGDSFKEGYTTAEINDLNNKYDVIDDNGNLLYKKDLNFKETIPNLKDAILEDTINTMNYNNNIYAISGIAIAFLVIGVIVLSNKS